MLPYLEKKSWPKMGKTSGESHYGFSEDDELIENALEELIQALHSKDSSQLMGALTALIHSIQNKEPDHATDALEDAQSI